MVMVAAKETGTLGPDTARELGAEAALGLGLGLDLALLELWTVGRVTCHITVATGALVGLKVGDRPAALAFAMAACLAASFFFLASTSLNTDCVGRIVRTGRLGLGAGTSWPRLL